MAIVDIIRTVVFGSITLLSHCFSASRRSDRTPGSRRVALLCSGLPFRTVQAERQTATAVVSGHDFVSSCGKGVYSLP